MGDTVRVLKGDFLPADIKPARTAPQKAQDEILETAEQLALDARESLTEALEWLGVVKPLSPAVGHLPSLVGQLIEEIRETRRMKP